MLEPVYAINRALDSKTELSANEANGNELIEVVKGLCSAMEHILDTFNFGENFERYL
jgi:hypothetical protein